MKNLIAVCALAFALNAEAGVSSLPIGSVERVLNNQLENTLQMSVAVVLDPTPTSVAMGSPFTTYTRENGEVETVEALCKRAAASPDKAELERFIESVLRDAAKATLEYYGDLSGRTVLIDVWGTWYKDGSYRGLNSLIEKYFKDLSKETILKMDYEVDLKKALLSRNYQLLYIPGIASLEIMDEHGNRLDTKSTVYENQDRVSVGPIELLVGGMVGTALARFRDGTEEVYKLSDGSPVHAQGQSPISIRELDDNSIEITTGSGASVLESSTDLRTWKDAETLPGLRKVSTGTYIYPLSEGYRFFRAR